MSELSKFANFQFRIFARLEEQKTSYKQGDGCRKISGMCHFSLVSVTSVFCINYSNVLVFPLRKLSLRLGMTFLLILQKNLVFGKHTRKMVKRFHTSSFRESVNPHLYGQPCWPTVCWRSILSMGIFSELKRTPPHTHTHLRREKWGVS